MLNMFGKFGMTLNQKVFQLLVYQMSVTFFHFKITLHDMVQQGAGTSPAHLHGNLNKATKYAI